MTKRIGGEPRRVTVVQAEGPEGARELRALVGVAPFSRDDASFFAIVVKLEIVLAEEGRLLAAARPATPAAMVPDVSADPPDAAGEILHHASDFALAKRATDVLVVGHARPEAPSATVEGGLDVMKGEAVVFSGRFSARAGAPADAIPLRAPYLAPLSAGAAARVAPSADPRRYLAGEMTGVEPELFQAAAPAWRADLGAVTPDATLRVRGLFGVPDGTTIALPGIEPVATLDARGLEGLPVPLDLDTLYVDADAGRGELTWRGTVLVQGVDDLSRIVLSLERTGAHRDASARLADTQRGVVRFAWTEDDAATGKPPPEEDTILEYHKHMTWNEVAPEPRLPLEGYARISAEIAERPKDRAKVLERHGLDDETFMVEERAWLERFAANATSGSGELAAYYGSLFIAAQDALATPDEERFTLRDYAGLVAEIERAMDPSVPLERAQMSLSQFMRLERRFTAKAEADPAVAAELASLLEELREGVDPLDVLREGEVDEVT